jgi:integrase
MQRNGYKSYIPPKEIFKTAKASYVPYIFSVKELKSIFDNADNMKIQKQSPYKHFIIPLLYRVLYGCGLRLSEALNLRLKDIDTNNKVLLIRYSKFNHQRIVPIKDSLNKRCITYLQITHLKSDSDSIFFANPNKKIYSTSSMYREFRKLLWKVGISHGGRGHGPRVHDLRHTFAVHCLKNWFLNGVDVSTSLPFLSAYLGHANLNGTQQYLRLTADVFPEITKVFEEKYGYCIPKLTGGECFEEDN